MQNHTKEPNLFSSVSKSTSLDPVPYNAVLSVRIFVILPSAHQVLAKHLLCSIQPSISCKAELELFMLQKAFVEYIQVKKEKIYTL